MIAKVLLFCAAVATAKATFGPGYLYPGLYGSGILAPGLLNTVISPGITYGGASILSAAAIPTSYTTTKTVVSAPAAVAAPVAIAAPVTYAKSIIAAPAHVAVAAPAHVAVAAPAHVAVAAPVTYAKSVIAAPAHIAVASPVTTYTKSVIAAPAAIAAPVSYSKTVVAAPAAINTYTQKTVIGATSLLTGTPLIYGNGILANRLVAAAAPLGYSTGIVSPIGLKGSRFVASPVVQTILKK